MQPEAPDRDAECIRKAIREADMVSVPRGCSSMVKAGASIAMVQLCCKTP